MSIKIQWNPKYGDLKPEEEVVLEHWKKQVSAYVNLESTSNDLPPLLDPSSFLTRIILESVKNPKEAKVGDAYIRRVSNAKAVHYKAKQVTKKEEITEEEEEVVTLRSAFQVWLIIQPKQDPKLEERRREIESRYAKMYKNKEEYACFYRQREPKYWPKDPFPNGAYNSERWVPKVWNEEKKRWTRASPYECKHWNEIPEEKKRVDYLFGILADTEEVDI